MALVAKDIYLGAAMLRALFALTLAGGVAVRALPCQAPTQRLRVEEGAIIAAEATRNPESLERVRSLVGRGDYESARRLALDARGFRIVISLDDRALWVLRDNDTIRTTSVGVASGLTLDYAGRKWTFRTPRGKHTVIGSRVAPYWTPPDWAYAETANQYKLKLAWLTPGKPVTLRDGRRLTVQDDAVGIIYLDGVFRALPLDEHIVFESTLYIPPHGTAHRRVKGQLGPYALDLGNGYLLHGGPASDGSGLAPTHGCIRLTDADLEWMYSNVQKGTPVYIY
ncbi:MAG: L,D-transpeptidase family protein [Gemmatimonadaceae bacterium]